MRASKAFIILGLCGGLLFLAACQPPAANSNVASINTNSNSSNSLSNSANSNTMASSAPVDAREPEQYQATVKLQVEAVGNTQTVTVPPIVANVARDANNRAMEFSLPTGEKVIYLDKGDNQHYLILPNRKQYAELTPEAVGFDIRRMMMPDQIVTQIKSIQGVQPAGEQTINGREAMKYTYSGTAVTQTEAGKVDTQSYLLVDKETGLPLHSETLSQTENGSNVQGYSGMKLVTDLSDIKTTPDPNLFNVPEGYAKIDPEQVRATANAIFNAVTAIVGQALKQAQPNTGATVSATPTTSPAG
ncbi:MAG TPA: hypothetical protein VL325_00970 [Pyrinomonadaceae bacterium]|nr:hypothetical protein [Pyrinomonadaceae bacterium]